VGDPQPFEGRVHRDTYPLAWPAEVLRAKSDLAFNIVGDDLPVGVLQQRADALRQRGQAHAARVLAIDHDSPCQFAAVAARDQPVQAAQQRRLAAAAAASDQDEFTGIGSETHINQGWGRRSAVTKTEVLDDQRR
jgi:hypothetical protein